MPIDVKKTAYWQLNSRLVVANNVNYGLFRVMAQERRADDAEARGEIQVGGYTSEWFRRKRDAFAEHRNIILEKNGQALNYLINGYKQSYEEAEKAFAVELQGVSTKKFDDIVFDGELIDADVIAEYNRQATQEPIVGEDGVVRQPRSPLVEAFYNYTEKRGTYKIAESVGHVYGNICADIDYRGYQNLLTRKNVTDEVKVVDSTFVTEFYEFAKAIPATYKAELIKTQVQLNKLLKQLKKDPENAELQALVAGHEVTVEFCQDVIERSDYLVMMSKILKERMDSVNKEPYGIRDKVVETLADFVFMVPSVSKGVESKPQYSTMYMGTYEITNLINCVKEFPEAAVFTQYLSSKVQLATIMPAANFEQSKIMMEFLKELHAMNVQTLKQGAEAQGISVSDAEVKVQATKPEIARFLQFETPLGRVWFDGENCVNVKTGEIISYAEICKYVLNPNDGKLYYLKTDQQIKPGTVTLVNTEPQTPGQTDGMGKN